MFIFEGTQIRRIPDHIDVDSQPAHISLACGPTLWDDCDAYAGVGVAVQPDWVWQRKGHLTLRLTRASIVEPGDR